MLLDRRLWHARGENHSDITRKAIFFAYTPRWVTIRDQVDGLHASGTIDTETPVRKQLLGVPGLGQPGQAEGDHRWGHYPLTTPLYTQLAERGLLIPHHPPLRP